MVKKTITLSVSVALLAGLFGTWYILRTGNEKAREKEEQENAGDEIVNIAKEDLSSISLELAGETVKFYKKDGKWLLEGDDHFTGDDEKFTTLLSYFSPLNAVRTLEDVEDIGEYGLDEPVNTFTLTGEDGKVATLAVGDNNEGTGDDYLMKDDNQSVVYTISPSLQDAVGDNLRDYALSEKLPTLSSDAITGIEVVCAGDGEDYTLVKEEGEWKKEGSTERLDQEELEDLVSDLGSLYYSDFVEYYCEDGTKYGLDGGKYMVITYEDEASDEADSADAETEEADETAAEADGGSVAATEADGGSVAATEADGGSVAATEADAGAETETEAEGEMAEGTGKVLKLYIGGQDDSGNYYVQQEGSDQVHTLSSQKVEEFLGLDTGQLLETEMETEIETETAIGTETEIETGMETETETKIETEAES